MVLDQQIPLERAFKAPLDLQARLGGQLEVGAIAAMDPEELASVFGTKPALHRFPKSMAGRVQEVCTVIVDSYGAVSYTHLRAHETVLDLVCRLLLEKKKT